MMCWLIFVSNFSVILIVYRRVNSLMFRHPSCFMGWYSLLSFRNRTIFSIISHISVILWFGISLFLSIDLCVRTCTTIESIKLFVQPSYIDQTMLSLQSNYALITLKARSVSLIVRIFRCLQIRVASLQNIGISFTVFFVFYISQFIFISLAVHNQLLEVTSLQRLPF